MHLSRFAVFAWGVLAYNLLVILWGAFVRATGSGAGCGSNWPLCNGAVIPRAPQVQTLVEYSHRLTSGVALLAVLVLLVWAFRTFPGRHRVRLGAVLSAFLILTEALIGAGLVLFELVAQNASIARAWWMAAHLVNTFFLLGALTLTAWWGSGQPRLYLARQGAVGWALLGGVLGMLVLGASGAVTALGDTLYPVSAVAAGRVEVTGTAELLIGLRAWHPALAMLVGTYLSLAATYVANQRQDTLTRQLAWGVLGIYLVQIAAGGVNVWLAAPVWMQIIHLLLADVDWITFVLLGAAALARRPEPAAVPAPAPRVAPVG